MGSTVLTSPARRKAQGRSVSGRNGGARKTTSPNSVVMRIALIDFVLVYVQVVLSSRYFMTIRSSSTAVCARSSFVPALLGRTQLAVDAAIFAIHVRVSSNCAYTYLSRWGRATCLSNWAQRLNMERLRARAAWRSHTQTPLATRKTARGWCSCGM